MSGLTRRFRLNKFGAGISGTISDDGQKFSSKDRDTIDLLLEQTELHDHHVRPVEGAPLAGLSAFLQPSGGSLRAGANYCYRYSLVDAQGFETVAAPEVVVVTPALLPAPVAPGLYVAPAFAAGALVGIYYYALTALRGAEESTLGAAAATSISSPDGAITLDLPAYGDADGFRVWRMGANDAAYTKIAVVNAPAGTFLDAGTVLADPCAGDPSNAPPAFNTGASAYSVVLTLPIGVSLTGKSAWRIYRTTIAGVYPVNSLVHQVVETVDEWDPTSALIRIWTDTGSQLRPGAPADYDANMRFTPFALDSAAALPNPAGYPESYPFCVGDTLYLRVNGAWAPVGGKPLELPGALIYTSLDGARWALRVANNGTVSAVATIFPGAPTPPQNVMVN